MTNGRTSAPAFFHGTITISIILASSLYWSPGVYADNTACATNQLDWYTSVVGETPCVTYERLRRICNPDYHVPVMRDPKIATPGDQCTDQVYSCCCNTVAFQLSMLCLNCQYAVANTAGIDTDPGTYAEYRGTCGGGTNHSLPDDIQRAVCNLGIRLDNFLYGGWDDGAWFYVWTKDNAARSHVVNNNNTFTHCPDQISPSATPNGPSTTSVSTTHSPEPPVSPSTSILSSSTSGNVNDGSSALTIVTSSYSGTSSLPQGTSITSQDGFSGGASSSQTLPGGPTQSEPAGSSGDTDVPNNRPVSKTSVIVGGVVGGIGAIVLGIAGYIVWRICRERRARSRATRGSPGGLSPPMSTISATPFGMSTTGNYTSTARSGEYEAPMPSLDEDPLNPASSHSPWSMYSEDVPRHADGGPVAGLVRSSSGRLPPAYRSWEHEDGNNALETGGTQSQASEHVHSRSSFSDANAPLAPLRRWGSNDRKEEQGV